MTRKTNTALIALLGTILMGLATWTLVTLIELQLTVTMIQTDLMSLTSNLAESIISSIQLEVNNEKM
jgi:hypothetical protein